MNILAGGQGFDKITGGSNHNLYVLTQGHGYDIITNFTDGRDAISHQIRGSEEIGTDITDFTIVDESYHSLDGSIMYSGNALIYYGDDLLAVVTGAAGMLEIGAMHGSGDNLLI